PGRGRHRRRVGAPGQALPLEPGDPRGPARVPAPLGPRGGGSRDPGGRVAPGCGRPSRGPARSPGPRVAGGRRSASGPACGGAARERSAGDPRRLGADHLLLRLSLRENPAFDPLPLAKAEAAKLKPESQAELWAQLARAAHAEHVWTRATSLWIE